MAHFYGTLQGRARTEATRCGTKDSGVQVQAASWQGSIRVEVYHREELEEDWASVVMTPWQGRGEHRLIYDGPVDRFEPTDYVTSRWNHYLSGGVGDGN